MTEPTLRPAHPGEGHLLSALALRSKGYWGYSAEFLESCREELAVSEDQLRDVTVAEVQGDVAGFSLLGLRGERGELHSLFVDLPWIGTGVGAALLRSALGGARAQGVREVGLDADPGAEAFYARFGAVTVGRSPSGSIPGRTLARMAFRL